MVCVGRNEDNDAVQVYMCVWCVPQVYTEMNIDLKITLPQWLLSFIINNLLGILFTCVQARAIEVQMLHWDHPLYCPCV